MAKIMTEEQIDEFIIGEIQRHKMVKNKPSPQRGRGWFKEPLLLRRQAVMKMLSKGLTKASCVKEIMSRWDVCEESARNYIKDAMEYIAENYKDDTEHLKDILMFKLESLAEDASLHNDRKSALKAYDQISKLAGLYEDKVKVEADTTIKFGFDGDN